MLLLSNRNTKFKKKKTYNEGHMYGCRKSRKIELVSKIIRSNIIIKKWIDFNRDLNSNIKSITQNW